MRRQLLSTFALLTFIVFLCFPRPTFARSFTVTTTADTIDSNDGVLSLREAIGVLAGYEPKRVYFDIDASTDEGCNAVTGVCTIKLLEELYVMEPMGITIDGYSQAGASPASESAPAELRIVIDGSLAPGGTNGLHFLDNGILIKGLVIQGFPANGIFIENMGYNTIEGCYIGTDYLGMTAVPNGEDGIHISASNNLIGGDTAAARNVISGNDGAGVEFESAASENIITGNYVGTDTTGTTAIPNLSSGIYIHDAAAWNEVGGSVQGEGNLICGNIRGVRIDGTGTDFNRISGNIIGLDITGTSILCYASEGVLVENDAANSVIGGDTSVERNVIVATNDAVNIKSGAHGTTVSGNYIGTDITGTAGMGIGTGISISNHAYLNTIGGPTSLERNIISGNSDYGVWIGGAATDGNQVLGNSIGVDVTGLNPLPNVTYNGVCIANGAQGNTIGPNNIIANHSTQGVYIYGEVSDFNVITQNSIYANAIANISLGAGANQDISAPTIAAVNLNPATVSGTTSPACIGCTIEVFTSLESDPQAGQTYLGSGTTDGSGDWTVMTPGLHGPYITATLTDPSKGTSMFSNAFFTTITSVYLPLITR